MGRGASEQEAGLQEPGRVTVQGSSAKLGAWVLILRARGSWVRVLKEVRMSSDLSATRMTLVSLWRIDGRIVREASAPYL